jgi:hypothetical protein
LASLFVHVLLYVPMSSEIKDVSQDIGKMPWFVYECPPSVVLEACSQYSDIMKCSLMGGYLSLGGVSPVCSFGIPCWSSRVLVLTRARVHLAFCLTMLFFPLAHTDAIVMPSATRSSQSWANAGTIPLNPQNSELNKPLTFIKQPTSGVHSSNPKLTNSECKGFFVLVWFVSGSEV